MESEKVFTTAPSPESQGIPSRAILNFLQRIDSERICMHGFLLVRHNKIAAEGYWAPWSAERMHRMYSVSKSFVALAVGMMIDEGRLTLDDRVAEYFPDKLPEELHPWLAASTVRDLLTMSTPHSTTSYTRDDPDWVWTFFNRILPPRILPGTIFSYDTAATVVLTATVERLASSQIDNAIRGNCGYGYQIWRDQENGFSFRGMGSQYAICFPDKEFLFTCIADTQGAPAGSAIPAVMREELYPHLSDAPLAENRDAHAELSDKIERLAVLPIPGAPDARAALEVNGAWYALADNPMGITRMRLSFKEDEGVWEYTNGQGDNVLRFGVGRVLSGKFPQRSYFGAQIGSVPGIEYDCLASAAWTDEQTLNMEVYITDIYLGGLRVSFAFKGEEIGVFMTKQAEWFLDEFNGFAGGRRF